MNKSLLPLLAGGAFVALPGLAFGQGTDDCATPQAISGVGSFAYDTTIATPTGLDFGGAPCELTMNEDVFFAWTAAGSGDFVFSLCSSTYDTQLQIAAGADCSAICVANNDDACGLQSVIALTGVVSGDQYLINVGAFSAGVVGSGLLEISTPPPPPANDDCSTPTVVSGLGLFPYDRSGATDSFFDGGDGAVTCLATGTNGSAGHKDVFLAWTAVAAGDYSFDTCSEGNDTQLSLHLGADCTAVCLDSQDGNVICGGGVDESQATIFGVAAGTTYLVQIGSWSATALFTNGPGDLNVTVPPPPPANDTCATPDVIAGVGSFPYDRTSASSSGFDGGDGVVTCLGAVNDGAGNNDVFFAWTPAISDNYDMSVALEGNDTMVNVHLGGDCAATCLFGSDPAEFTFPGAIAGTTYLIQIGNWSATSTAVGPGSLDIVVAPPPPANDTCATPDVIAGVGSFPYDRTSAVSSGFDGGDGAVTCLGAVNDGAGNRDVFFAWTPAISDNYNMDVSLEGNDTMVNIHLGGDCAATCLFESDPSTFTFLGATAGTTYLIQIGNWSASSTAVGPGSLDIVQTPPPPANDTCATPTAITGLGSFAYDNTSALNSGFQGAAAGCTGPDRNSDLFYVWTAVAAGDRRFETCTVSYDTTLAVYSGADCTATCIGDNDDACALQSQVDVFGVNAGDQLLIQVGSFGATTQGPGTLDVIVAPPPPTPPTNDTCATADVAVEGTTVWNNELATTSGFDGGDPVNCMSPANPDTDPLGQCQKDLFWVFTAPCDADFQIDTEGSTGNTDTRLNIHLGSDCSATCLQSDDDSGATPTFSSLSVLSAVAGQDYLIQIGSWTATSSAGDGLLNITNISGGPCESSGIVISCDPASPHYLGSSATLASSTVGAATASGLHLECTDGPAGEFGFFLVSAGSSVALNIFNGVLCLDAPQGRYNPLVATNQGLPVLNSVGQFDAAGVLQNLVGTATSTGGSGYDVPLELPFTPPGQTISVGDTWYFQAWYRDQIPPLPNPGSSANFSNVAGVTF